MNGDSHHIKYVIRAGDDRKAFGIDENLGQTYVADSSQIDYEQKWAFKLIVEVASDVGANPVGDDREYVAFTKVCPLMF